MANEETTSTAIEENNNVGKTESYIVGEHSVYNSVEDLLNGARQKEAMITKLLEENKTLRAQYENLSKSTSVIDELKTLRQQELQSKDANTDNTKSMINPDTIKDIALKAMQEQSAIDKANGNLKDCQDAVTRLTGDCDLAFKNKANELGITVDYLKDIAKTSPKAFKNMFGIKEERVITPDFLQSTKQVSTTNNESDSFFKNKEALKNPKAIASFMERAMKDPSLLNNIKW